MSGHTIHRFKAHSQTQVATTIESRSARGPHRPTLRGRLRAVLREAPSGPELDPLTSLYLTDDEWAAEIVNRNVHGVMHIGQIPDQGGGYRGQMSVYVKRNGLLGSAYMAAIAPLRHLIVYPLMLRDRSRVAGTQRRPADDVMTRPGTGLSGMCADRAAQAC